MKMSQIMSTTKTLTDLCAVKQNVTQKKIYLKINCKQTVKIKRGSIRFKNYHKQLTVPFKIYADFECNVKKIKRSDKSTDKGENASYAEKYQSHIPCSFAYKLVGIDDKLRKPIVFCRGRNTIYKFIEAILEEYDYRKKKIKKHFNKNLVTYPEDEEKFQLSNKCWICDKLFDVGDDEVRYYCHVTGKYRDFAHWSSSVVNLKFTKNILVIFHNLRGYGSHLIMQEMNKSDVKVSVIPNGLEKYMTLTINNNLVFVDSMKFMNSSLNQLVKNLSDNDFKCL